jgi:hypothetical protein
LLMEKKKNSGQAQLFSRPAYKINEGELLGEPLRFSVGAVAQLVKAPSR